jgi:hypothetical protein
VALRFANELAFCAGLLLVGCNALADAAPDTERSMMAVPEGGDAEQSTVTRAKPVASQRVAQAPPSDLAFARVTIAAIENAAREPLYFELYLIRKDPSETVRLGSFAPFPPDRAGSYLIGLKTSVEQGDRLELRMIFTQPAEPGAGEPTQVRIDIQPIQLLNRAAATKRP